MARTLRRGEEAQCTCWSCGSLIALTFTDLVIGDVHAQDYVRCPECRSAITFPSEKWPKGWVRLSREQAPHG